jgi:hypothetical protein
MTVRFKLMMTVRLENIFDDGPLEALSMTLHMAFVDDRTLPRKTGSANMCRPKCVDDMTVRFKLSMTVLLENIVDDSPHGVCRR